MLEMSDTSIETDTDTQAMSTTGPSCEAAFSRRGRDEPHDTSDPSPLPSAAITPTSARGGKLAALLSLLALLALLLAVGLRLTPASEQPQPKARHGFTFVGPSLPHLAPPASTSVSLVGSWDDKPIKLQPSTAQWHADLELPCGEHIFRYRVTSCKPALLWSDCVTSEFHDPSEPSRRIKAAGSELRGMEGMLHKKARREEVSASGVWNVRVVSCKGSS